jgi:hypothetical protein
MRDNVAKNSANAGGFALASGCLSESSISHPQVIANTESITTDTSIDVLNVNFGNDEYHNNVSPCISGYSWIRIS